MSRELLVHANRESLVRETAERFVTTVTALLSTQSVAHVVLTGGSVGIEVLAAVREHALGVDWSRVHCWWGDERWLPRGDAERNATQAREALLDHVGIPAENLHELGASDEGVDLDQAAATASAELDAVQPTFDVLFLGMGPDAHVASLFPGYEGARSTATGVIAVRNSPKPPPERLSLTRATINAADRVWLVVAGDDKASALTLALDGANPSEVPAAGVHGTSETLYLVDRDAASLLPDGVVT